MTHFEEHRLAACLLTLLSIAPACDGDDDNARDDGGSGGSGGMARPDGGASGANGQPGGGASGLDAAADTGVGPEGGIGPDGGPGFDAGPGVACPLPEDGLLAVFEVVGETFRANITESSAIDQAIALWEGESAANIPNGGLVCEPAPYNCGYGWHLNPAGIEFAELTIEVCDGTPSYIEENCQSFGDRYCPWDARLVELRDCREAGCPVVAQ